MIEIGNLTLPENLNLGLPEDDLVRRCDAVNAIRKACIMAHIPFSTRTPEGRRTIEAMQAVRNVPAVDAAPVVHAHWIVKGANPSHGTCSHCEGKGNWRNPFCPNCGAKMDEEG